MPTPASFFEPLLDPELRRDGQPELLLLRAIRRVSARIVRSESAAQARHGARRGPTSTST